MAISLRLHGKEKNIIKNYAKLKGINVSELLRRSIIAKIEDEIDLETYRKFEKSDDGQRYILKEVKGLCLNYEV